MVLGIKILVFIVDNMTTVRFKDDVMLIRVSDFMVEEDKEWKNITHIKQSGKIFKIDHVRSIGAMGFECCQGHILCNYSLL